MVRQFLTGCGRALFQEWNIRLQKKDGDIQHFITYGMWKCGDLKYTFIRYCETCARKGGLLW